MAGKKRGPKGEPYQLVELKGQTHQLQRAEADGRAELYRDTREAEGKIPAMKREIPPMLRGEPLNAQQWREFIVDGWGALGILKTSDEVLINELCWMLEQTDQMRKNGLKRTIVNTKGDLVENPEIRVYFKYQDRIFRALVQAGMTPAARAQVYQEMTTADRNVAEKELFIRKTKR